MIQIQPYSFISSISLYFTALYLRTIHQFFKIKLRLTHPAQRTFRPTTYFVVQSKFFSFKDATKRIETIRKYDKRGKLSLLENILIMNCCLEITILFSVSLIEPMIIL